MKYILLTVFSFSMMMGYAQQLKLKKRPAAALSGSEFVKSISDTTISREEREAIILKEIRSGNIPQFYRKLAEIRDTTVIEGKAQIIKYFVLPDYLSIGSNEDYFYCPMTPVLAQKVANLMDCSLPTRKISDRIYQNAQVKMVPEPIPPSKKMITVGIFAQHNQTVLQQRQLYLQQFPLGSLVAGNKKDIVISDKMYKDGSLRVVIYGWHQPGGKAIQPLYNGHTDDWADYSHGIRLVQNKIWVNGKKTSIQKILTSPQLAPLLSDEGMMQHAAYPAK